MGSQSDKVAQGLSRKVLKISKNAYSTAFLLLFFPCSCLCLLPLAIGLYGSSTIFSVTLWQVAEGNNNTPTSNLFLFRLNNLPTLSVAFHAPMLQPPSHLGGPPMALLQFLSVFFPFSYSRAWSWRHKSKCGLTSTKYRRTNAPLGLLARVYSC